MQPKFYRLFRFTLLIASTSLAFGPAAHAGSYYWDTDGSGAPGFGTASGIWGTSNFWGSDSSGSGATANTAITTTDDVNFGTASAGLAAGTITGPSTAQGFLNMTFGSASGAILLSGGKLNLNTTTGSTITVNNASDTISTALQGSGGKLNKTGTGTLKLTSGSTYSGTTTVNQGTLELAAPNASGGGLFNSSGITVNNGGQILVSVANALQGYSGTAGTVTINAGGSMTTANGITSHIRGALVLNGGTLASGTPDGTYGSWNLNGDVTATGTTASTISATRVNWGGTRTFTVSDAAGNLNVTGYFNGGAALTKSGSGKMTLTGASSTLGNVNVNQGELFLNNGNNAAPLGTSSARTITIAAGATLTAGGDNPFSTGTNVPLVVVNGTMNSARYQHMNNIDMTAGTITPNGSQVDGLDIKSAATVRTYAASTSSSIASKMTLNADNVTFNVEDGAAATDLGISGVMVGSKGIIKSGAGTMTLIGINTYSGGTTVNSGILELSGASDGNGLIRGALTVNAGAEVRLTNGDGTGFGYHDARIGSIAINGGVVTSAGILHIWNVAGGVTLTGGSLSSNGGVSSATDPQIEWGNTTLTSNASAATATVAGRVNIRRDAAPVLRVNVADGTATTDLLISAALTESGPGCGLVKSGAGTLKLGGAVNLTGFITVNDGTLDLSSATLGEGARINMLPGAQVIPPASGLPATAALFINGEKLAPGAWGAPGSVAAGLAQFESPAFSGSTVMSLADTGISNRERWKSLKYGIFSHYTYMATGTGDVNEAANAFNATQYANDLAEAGVQYVVWTAWHGNTFPMFPSQTMVKYGWPKRFSTRDTVSDMIDAVKAKGIRVYLYTHPYQPIVAQHNDFINELYAELIARYGSRIDGLWLDENQIDNTQDRLVDYKRLMATIREGNPDLVTMQNGSQMYTVDMGGPEVVGKWNYGWSECMYNLANPGSGPDMDDMLRTTVLEAAANFEGGGMHWSIDGAAYVGLVETTRAFALGRYLAPIRPSVCDTTPSASFPPLYKDGRKVKYADVDWVATTSIDEGKEFIHVLKAPAGNTLTLPGTADGKVFGSATLMASLQTGGGTQQYLGLPMAMIQTPRGIQLTLPAGVSWSTHDTVIRLDVASKGGAGMVNNTSTSITYNGSSWGYQNHRGAGEYHDDAHTATANGDSFTFTFSGNDVEYLATRGAGLGPVDIYIDEVFQTTIDLSSGTAGSRQTVFRKSGLVRGTHTLRAVKMGGTLMELDALKVTELINDGDADLAASFPSTLALDAGSAAYTGLWQPGSGALAWITPGAGYLPGAEPLTGSMPTSGDSFEFSFYGTSASVTVGSQHSWGYFYFMVDGVYQSNVQVSTSSGLQTFSTATLPLGNHTIRGIVWRVTGDPFQPGVSSFTVTRPDLWHYQSGRGYGEIGDDVHYTDVNPGAFSFDFNGSGVEVITTRDSDARMAWFGVSGMGRSVGARRNNYSPIRLTGGSVFSMPNLTPGTHSVSVQHGANTSGLNFTFARLAIDALRVYKGESLSSAPLFWGATGNGGSGTWDIGTTANWNDGGQSTPWHDFGGNDYTAMFTGTAGTVNLASNINANRLTFKTAGYTLQGGSLTLTGSAPTLLTDANATIASTLNGSSGLTKSGSGTLSITGSNAYTGATSIAAGTLVLNGSYATPGFAIASGAVLEFNAATSLNLPAVTISGTGTLRKTGANELRWGSTTAVFALGSGSLIDVQGGTFVGGSHANENWTNNLSDLNVATGAVFAGVEANVRVDVLTGSGVISSGYPGSGYSAFTFGVDNGSGTFHGSLVNGYSPGSFIKTGTGTQTLAGANTYTGSTTIEAGKLILSGSLNHTSSLTIASGATLEISGSLAATGNIVNNGTLILTGAPQMSAGGTITNNGTIINLAPGYPLPPNLVNNGNLQAATGMSADYATWAGNAGVIGGPDADDDGDGINNRAEYAFALNPKSGSSANPVAIPFKHSDGTFTYTRRDPALGTNFTYTVWISPDLVSWTRDASAVQTVISTQGEVQFVRVNVSSGPLSQSGLFVQIRAAIP